MLWRHIKHFGSATFKATILTSIKARIEAYFVIEITHRVTMVSKNATIFAFSDSFI